MVAFVFSLLLVASQVNALSVRDASSARTSLKVFLANSKSLSSRQSGLEVADFPVQCQLICTPVVNFLDTCIGGPLSEEDACVCTNPNGKLYESCLSCVVELNPTASQRRNGQEALDEFVQICEDANITINPLTISGGSPSSGPSATNTVSSRTGTAFATGTTAESAASASAPGAPLPTSSGSGGGIIGGIGFTGPGANTPNVPQQTSPVPSAQPVISPPSSALAQKSVGGLATVVAGVFIGLAVFA